MKYTGIIIITLASIVLVFYILIVFPSIFNAFLAEYFAGLLGILLAFGLNREIEKGKRLKISEQIRDNLIVELEGNLVLVRRFKKEIIPQTINKRLIFAIPFFNLFQVSAWNMFSTRLEQEDITILSELGVTYHKLGLFNEAMKTEATGFSLAEVLEDNPKFLAELEKDIVETIDKLR